MSKTDEYLVWNMSRGLPTRPHYSLDAAVAEAERLAKSNPGETFHVMAPVGAAMVEKPTVFRFHQGMAGVFGTFENLCVEVVRQADDGMPF